MISRRLVRTKTLQLLYSYEMNPSQPQLGLERNLQNSLTTPDRLYLYYLYYMLQIANYATTFNERQESKLLREDDKAVQGIPLRFYSHPLIVQLRENEYFTAAAKKEKFALLLDQELLRKLHADWVKHPAHRTYLFKDELLVKDHKEVLKALWKRLLMRSEAFVQHLEDNFPNYEEEEALVLQMLIFKIGEYPETQLIAKPDLEEQQTYEQFANQLLLYTLDHSQDILSIITTHVKNWDLQRLSQVDIVLLKMAVIEFLYFPTIPTKVTINEYMEISKIYSSPKSHEFLNGVLDHILQDLSQQNKIQKVGRGLVG